MAASYLGVQAHATRDWKCQSGAPIGLHYFCLLGAAHIINWLTLNQAIRNCFGQQPCICTQQFEIGGARQTRTPIGLHYFCILEAAHIRTQLTPDQAIRDSLGQRTCNYTYY